MISGSFLSVHWMKDSSRVMAMLDTTTNTNVPKFILGVGGMLLLFGARMAGGCTSGHGNDYLLPDLVGLYINIYFYCSCKLTDVEF